MTNSATPKIETLRVYSTHETLFHFDLLFSSSISDASQPWWQEITNRGEYHASQATHHS